MSQGPVVGSCVLWRHRAASAPPWPCCSHCFSSPRVGWGGAVGVPSASPLPPFLLPLNKQLHLGSHLGGWMAQTDTFCRISFQGEEPRNYRQSTYNSNLIRPHDSDCGGIVFSNCTFVPHPQGPRSWVCSDLSLSGPVLMSRVGSLFSG